MQCLQCGKRLPLLRKLKDAEFCSEEHRDEFSRNQRQLALTRLMTAEAAAEPPRERPKPVAASFKPPKQMAGLIAVVLQGSPSKPAGFKRSPVTPIRTRLWVATPRLEKRGRRRHTVPSGGLTELTLSPRSTNAARRDFPPEAEPSLRVVIAPAALEPVRLEWPAERPPVTAKPAAPKPAQQGGTAAPTQRVRRKTISAAPAKPQIASARPDPPLPPAAAPVAPPEPPPPVEPADPPRAEALQALAGPDARAVAAERRIIPPQPLAQRQDWRPKLVPRLDVKPDFAATKPTVAGVEAQRLQALAEPKAALPRPAVITPPAPAKAVPVQIGMPPRSPKPVDHPEAKAVWGTGDAWQVAKAAVGERLPIPIRPHTVETRARCVAPQSSPPARRGVDLAGKLNFQPPVARFGDSVLWLTSDPYPIDARTPVRAVPVRIPAPAFDPPPATAVPWTPAIAPRRDAKCGRRVVKPLPVAIARAPIACSSNTEPILDWLPVSCPVLPLEMEVRLQPMPPRASHAGLADWVVDPAGLPVHTAKTTGIPRDLVVVVRLEKQRLRSLPLHDAKLLTIESKPHALTVFETMMPSPAVGKAGIRPRKPWTPRFERLVTAPPWMRVVYAGADKWRMMPSAPKWVALALVTAITVSTLVPGRSPANAPLSAMTTPEPLPPPVEVQEEVQPKAPPTGIRLWLSKRAAVSLTDDFRGGLSAWQGGQDWARTWAYDSSGFVRTGQLALFSPSMSLNDYRMEFLGQIEKRSLGWAVRAQDMKNYYAIRLTLTGSGAGPMLTLTRYPVVNGVAGRAVTRELPAKVQSETLLRVLTEVRGDDFAVQVQGQVADVWNEPRMDRGGVGFFSAAGEQARLSWVGVWHQDDTIGRLCALLAPASLHDR